MGCGGPSSRNLYADLADLDSFHTSGRDHWSEAMDSPECTLLRMTVCLRQRVLDREIASGLPVDETRPRALRASQLSSRLEQRAIAACLQTLLDRAEAEADDGRALTGVRGALIASRYAICTLIDRLRSESVVDARGVALAQLLIEDRDGPLFHPLAKRSLDERLADAIGAL